MDADRYNWHQEESGSHQIRMENLNLAKARAARVDLTIQDLIEKGPRGVRVLADAKAVKASADFANAETFRLMAETGYSSQRDEFHQRAESISRRGGRFLDESYRLVQLAEAMDVPWLVGIRLAQQGRGEESQMAYRRAVVLASGWDDCGCGAAFAPGEKGYRQCYRCSRIEYARGSVACALCGRRHSMKFAACFACKSEGREEASAQLRSVILRRDGYTCQMCGRVDGGERDLDDDGVPVPTVGFEVDHILPCALGGKPDPWNLQAMCTPCNLLKGARYGRYDERARFVLMQEYMGSLKEFLLGDEIKRLHREIDNAWSESELIGGFRSKHGLPWPDLGETDAESGILNVVSMLGARPISAIVPRAAEKFPMPEFPPKPKPCKGHVFSSTEKRACKNLAHPSGSLCEGPCP